METKNYRITLLIVLSSFALLFFPLLGIVPFVLSIITYGMISRSEDQAKIVRNIEWIKGTLWVVLAVLLCTAWRLISMML